MKKSLLLGITGVTLLALTATTLYAQTAAGTSIVDKMKAAVADFTLSTVLNPGETGLKSAPIAGKKTGDILTAGEWNRVLEIIASAGGGISDVELITSQAASPSATADYSFRVSQANCPAGKKIISGGCSYPNTLNTFVHNTPTPDLTGWICGGLHHDGDATNNATKYPYRPTAYAVCGTYGSGGGNSSTGGGVEIVSGGVITNTGTVTEHTLSGNWDLITLEGAWKSGDAAPSGGYIYKLGGQKKMSISIATGVAKDTVLTNDYQCAQDFCVKLSGENVIIKPGISTVAYLMWKFGGSTGMSGWVDVPLADTADYDTNCEYRFQMNKAMLDGVWSFGSPTPVGNHYYYATYVANNIITASGTYNVMHGIPKATKNKMFLYWVNGTGVDSSANYSIAKIQKRCN